MKDSVAMHVVDSLERLVHQAAHPLFWHVMLPLYDVVSRTEVKPLIDS